MNSSDSEEFTLYLSSFKVNEADHVEFSVTYAGESNETDRLLLIGTNNNLKSDISQAKLFEVEEQSGQCLYTITFPIWEEGTFQAVIQSEEKYIYEPGEAHTLSFRAKSIFLDLRKIYHLTKKPVRAIIEESKPEIVEKVLEAQSESIEEIKEEIVEEEKLPVAYDEKNMLNLKPKEFHEFTPELKIKILQLLDYFTNQKSKQLVLDPVILPDIARSLKQLIAEELRFSIYEACFPLVILIEKALMLFVLIQKEIPSEENINKYKTEVAEKAEEFKDKIKNMEFKKSIELIKREYDDDVHNLKMLLIKEF